MSTPFSPTLRNFFTSAGYSDVHHLSDILQGHVWKGKHTISQTNVVIKQIDRRLHESKSTKVSNAKTSPVNHNIIKEAGLLLSLSTLPYASNYIISYLDSFQNPSSYFLVMKDGGDSLFHMVTSSHSLIKQHRLSIIEWQRISVDICRKMAQCLTFLHSYNISHFDISLENWLVDDIQVCVDTKTNEMTFNSNIQIRLCDFGLAEQYMPNQSGITSRKYCGKRLYQSPEVFGQQLAFDPFKNDIWCYGVCVFMVVIGSSPWHAPNTEDQLFNMIMKGELGVLLKAWNKEMYASHCVIDMLHSIFQLESHRISLFQLLQCKYLQCEGARA